MATPSTTPGPQCHRCDYDLSGLPEGAAVCPECGASLSAAAFALAEAKRIARSRTARLALLAAPAVGIYGSIPIFGSIPIMLVRHGGWDAGAFFLLCLWAGGATAVYYAAPRHRRRLPRAILIGLPLGAVYFAVVLGIAVGIVFAIQWSGGR